MNLGGVELQLCNGVLSWSAGLAVDSDGAPAAYAPPGNALQPLDRLANAGHVGNWWGIVTDTGLPDGEPIVQGPLDPAPGYFVSTTSLTDRARAVRDPLRYVDASRVPYLVIPPELRALGVQLGDVARVDYRNQWSPAIVADIGPRRVVGEGSIALARALGIDPSPIHGGVARGVRVQLYVGSSLGWPRTPDAILLQVQQLCGAQAVA